MTETYRKNLSRRDFLKLLSTGAGAVYLAGCLPETAPAGTPATPPLTITSMPAAATSTAMPSETPVPSATPVVDPNKVGFRMVFNVEYASNPDIKFLQAGVYDLTKGVTGILDTRLDWQTFSFTVAELKAQLSGGSTILESFGIIPYGAKFDATRWVSVDGWPRNMDTLWLSDIRIGSSPLLTAEAQRDFTFRCFQSHENYYSQEYAYATYATNGVRSSNEGINGGPCVKYTLAGGAGASWMIYKETVDLSTLSDTDTLEISMKPGKQVYEKWSPDPVVAAPLKTPRPTYEIGPGRKYENISDMPWENLKAGDVVFIHWREKAYQEKIGIDVQGTAEKPVIIHGVPGPNGQLPKIDGHHAVTRETMPLFGQQARLVSLGSSLRPAQYVTIENLEIYNANKFKMFYLKGETKLDSYNEFCAGLYVEWGENITIRDCTFHDCSNGLFVSSFSNINYYSEKPPLESETQFASRDILVEGNTFYKNGVPGKMFDHHSYCAAINTTYQFNYYSTLANGSTGYSLKDRGSGTVIRYNWIEDGRRQISLDDAQDCPLIVFDSRYADSYVYGNILIEPDDGFQVWGDDEIISFGGDDENVVDRNGTLYLTNNTIVTYRTQATYNKYNTVDRAKGRLPRTCLLYMPMRDQSADVTNNIFFAVGDAPLTIMNDSGFDNPSGAVQLSHNWFNTGWTPKMEGFAIVKEDGSTITGTDPGFVSLADQDFHLRVDSACVNAGTSTGVLPSYEYKKHQAVTARSVDAQVDIGAYEYKKK